MEPIKRPRRGHSPITGRHRVMTAVSNDTLNWVCDGHVLFPGSVPDVIRLNDGSYIMYYCGWEKSKMSYDGIHWFYLDSTYKSVSGEELPRRADPCVVALEDGKYRLYTCEPGKRFFSAKSSDCVNWIHEGTIFEAMEGERLFDLDVIRMGNVWRMYYSCPPNTLSAVSEDGIHWIREDGSRIAGGTVTSIYELSDGKYRIYYHIHVGKPPNVKMKIVSSTSEDGLTWTMDAGIRIEDPVWDVSNPTKLLRMDDGSYRIYYVRGRW